MATKRVYRTIFISFFFLCGCGALLGGGGDDRELSAPLLPARDLILTTTMEHGPFETNEDVRVLDFAATLDIPLELKVIQGNSGVGWVGLRVGPRKFCYQGNAISERTGGGDLFFLRHETNIFSPCEILRELVLDPIVSIGANEIASMKVENPGCSIEAGTCVFTEVRAVLEVLETFP